MAISPRVKLLGESTDGFPKVVLVLTITVVTIAIAALTTWKLSYEKEQREVRDASRSAMVRRVQKQCQLDLECLRQELSGLSAAGDNLAQSLQDETADWTYFILILGVVTGGVSVLGLVWIRASLLAAREANALNAAAIITSERGWVFSTVRPLDVLRLEHDGESSSLHIGITNRNAGKTAAINVHTNVHSSDLHSIPLVMDMLATESLEFDSEHHGTLVPPGESYEREWSWTNYDRFEIEFRSQADFIVGCVTYETLFDDKKHQTGFVYLIEPTDELNGKPILRPWSGGFAT
ncbi:hypothetical protein [Rhizobium sp. 2MFCol3.1]|uniref:hypothetical protein n=1 Tax=Rhizobium sp. 2MFCol3.1 TaxID=1246459 RepID=UPI0012DC7287|nr:hypothetical protein [Rhizobium sp. 2MFCol3.1]